MKFFLVLAGIIWALARGTEALGYQWQWYRVPHYILSVQNGKVVPGPLLAGLWVTLQITGIGLFLALMFGLTAALFRLSHSPLARGLSRIYLEAIRNTPLLVQLFFMYFVLSPVLGISRFSSAVLSLSLFEGAYASEIFRAGILSVDRGQWDASRSLGMGTYHTYRYIVLPQAVRHILPALAGQAISLVKDSALVSTIAIYDLTMRGEVIIARTYLTFEMWFTIAGMYLVITLTLSLVVSRMERMSRFGIR